MDPRERARQQQRQGVPPPRPRFATDRFHEAEIGGRKLRFYEVSGIATMRLAAIADQLEPIGSVMFDGEADDDARQGAMIRGFQILGQHPELLAFVILDSLHDEPWNKRPASPADCETFLTTTDGAQLIAMTWAVIRANSAKPAEAGAGPPAQGLAPADASPSTSRPASTT
jgi:hypothetical protein